MSPLHLLSGAGTQNIQREAQLQKQARGSEYHTDAREHGACLLLLQVRDDTGMEPACCCCCRYVMTPAATGVKLPRCLQSGCGLCILGAIERF